MDSNRGYRLRSLGTLSRLTAVFVVVLSVVITDLPAQDPSSGEASEPLATPSDTQEKVVELQGLEAEIAEAIGIIRRRASDPIELRDQLVEFERLNREVIARANSLRHELAPPQLSRTRLPEPSEISRESTLRELEAVIYNRIETIREEERDPSKLRDRLVAFESENKELMGWYNSARERARVSTPRSRPVLAERLPGETDDQMESREIQFDVASAIDTLRERAGDPIKLRDLLVEFEGLNRDLLERMFTLLARRVEDRDQSPEPVEDAGEGE